MNVIEPINAAHADPDGRGLRLSSTRGGDESRRSFTAMAEEAQRTAAGGSEAVMEVQQAAPIAVNDLNPVLGKSRSPQQS